MTVSCNSDIFFMQQAYQQALLAYDAGEVPVGAILISNDLNLISKDYNKTITLNDPTAHAEILVLRSAAQSLNNHRLVDSKLYVTLEPCIMCCGALIQARISKLVYGCDDARIGILSQEKIQQNKNINHDFEIVSGVMSEKCGELLKKFFKEKRIT